VGNTNKLEQVLALIDGSIDNWRSLERDVGLDAEVSLITVIDELEYLRESICLIVKRPPQS